MIKDNAPCFVMLEFDEDDNRVIIRGVFNDMSKIPDKLKKDNHVNVMSVFENVDMGRLKVFSLQKENK